MAGYLRFAVLVLVLLGCWHNEDGSKRRDCGWCDCQESTTYGKHVWDLTQSPPHCRNCGASK